MIFSLPETDTFMLWLSDLKKKWSKSFVFGTYMYVQVHLFLAEKSAVAHYINQ